MRITWALLLLASCASPTAPRQDRGEVVADSASIDFGNVLVGETSYLVIRFQNRSPSPGTASLSTQSPFAASALTEGSLAPGGIGEIEVAFAPERAGEVTGELVVGLPGVPRSARVALRGSGGLRSAEIPPRLDVGTVELGSATSAVLPVRNTAPALQVFSVEIESQDGHAWSLSARRLAVPPGSVGEVGLVFRPTAETSQVANLKLQACSGCAIHRVLATGRGIDPALDTSPASIDFGAVPPGGKAVKQLLVRNRSTGPVRVDSARIVDGAASPFSLAVAGLPVDLAPGSLPLEVRFAPGSKVPSSAQLRVEIGGKLLTVPLAGLGGDGGLEVTPAALDFGRVPASAPPTRAVEVRDRTSGPGREVTGVRIEGPGASRFLADPRRELPTPARDEPLEIDVSMTGASPGRASAELVITFAGATERRVPLAGDMASGGYCQLELDPGEIAFGLRPYDEDSERTLLIRNEASIECTVGPFVLDGSPAFSLGGVDPSQGRLVAAHGALSLPIRYRPQRGRGREEAVLHVLQTSAGGGDPMVRISGHGGEPALVADPPELLLPPTPAGADRLEPIDLINLSPFPLRLDDQRLVGSADLELLEPASSLLPVGGQVTAHVLLRASDQRALADLQVAISGAAAPLVVPVSAPRSSESCGASCAATLVSCPSARHAFIQRSLPLGGAAFRQGATPTCDWSLGSAPPGSHPVLAKAGCQAVFRSDLPGSYELELTASAGGETATCSTPLEVEVFPGLWIESLASTGGGGVEMHLFESGAGSLESATTWLSRQGGHASVRNPRPGWDAPGRDDDPIVEAGASGTPQVVRIAAPQPSQDYELGLLLPARGARLDVDVETTIWCAGVPAFSVGSRLSPGTAVHVGTIRIDPGGTCTFTGSSISAVVLP